MTKHGIGTHEEWHAARLLFGRLGEEAENGERDTEAVIGHARCETQRVAQHRHLGLREGPPSA
jgi:hypothetical protein